MTSQRRYLSYVLNLHFNKITHNINNNNNTNNNDNTFYTFLVGGQPKRMFHTLCLVVLVLPDSLFEYDSHTSRASDLHHWYNHITAYF